MPSKGKSPSQQPVHRGWRMDPIPGRPAYRDGEGNVRVPVWLTRDGRHVADTEMVLLPSEAELLGERLTAALDGEQTLVHKLFQGQAVAMGPGVTVVSKLTADGA